MGFLFYNEKPYVLNFKTKAYKYIGGDDYMLPEKKIKPKLKFTYYNPNTPEITRKLLKDIIVKILADKKIDFNADYSNSGS